MGGCVYLLAVTGDGSSRAPSGGMSERCALSAKLFNGSGTYPEWKAAVGTTGHFEDIFDSQQFRVLNDKGITPELRT